MVTEHPKTHMLQEVCLSLLNRVIASGKSQTDIANDLGCATGTVSKWLSRYQNIKADFIAKILDVYGGGMDAETIARLVEVFEDDVEMLVRLLAIKESPDRTLIEKIRQEINFLYDRVK
jgi:transcriptional regulator with XRE-family HTH domain